jgi:hypothetical protein
MHSILLDLKPDPLSSAPGGGRWLARQKAAMPERIITKEEVAESFEKAKAWEGVMVTLKDIRQVGESISTAGPRRGALKGPDGYALGGTSKES